MSPFSLVGVDVWISIYSGCWWRKRLHLVKGESRLMPCCYKHKCLSHHSVTRMILLISVTHLYSADVLWCSVWQRTLNHSSQSLPPKELTLYCPCHSHTFAHCRDSFAAPEMTVARSSQRGEKKRKRSGKLENGHRSLSPFPSIEAWWRRSHPWKDSNRCSSSHCAASMWV